MELQQEAGDLKTHLVYGRFQARVWGGGENANWTEMTIKAPCFGGCCGEDTQDWDGPLWVGGVTPSSDDVGRRANNQPAYGWVHVNPCRDAGAAGAGDHIPAWGALNGAIGRQFRQEFRVVFR